MSNTIKGSKYEDEIRGSSKKLSMEWEAGLYEDVLEMMGALGRSKKQIALLLRIELKELKGRWNQVAYNRGIELNKMYLLRQGLEQSGRGNNKILETFLSHALGIQKKEVAAVNVNLGSDIDGSYKMKELSVEERAKRYGGGKVLELRGGVKSADVNKSAVVNEESEG